MINLCFHGIGMPTRGLEPGEAAYWISRDSFRRILDLVVERDDVCLSFDDGNWSDVEHALPALEERDLTATFFVLAGRLGQRGSLDDGAVRALRDAGMTIGSHGMDHVTWRRMDSATVGRELVDARERLSIVAGRPVREAALPRGQYDRMGLRQLRMLGYETVHTSDRAHAHRGSWLQPRFSIRAGDDTGSVRDGILHAPSRRRRLVAAAKIAVKRAR